MQVQHSIFLERFIIMKKTLTLERFNQVFNESTSSNCIIDVKNFINLLNNSEFSKKTRYHELDCFSDIIYGFIHEKLNSYNFVNGDKEANKNNYDGMLWFKIYSNVYCYEYSPFYKNLNEECSLHHASAYARAYCLQKELENFIQYNKL